METKKYNTHGIISMVLFLISMGIGVASVAIYSVFMSLVSVLITALALIVVSICYCSKCKCRTNCNHLIFGKISVLFSKPNAGKYTGNDLVIGTLLPILVAIAFPQYWLVKSPNLLIAYWVIMIVAGLEIYFFVCTSCFNDKCSMCRNKKMKENYNAAV